MNVVVGWSIDIHKYKDSIRLTVIVNPYFREVFKSPN